MNKIVAIINQGVLLKSDLDEQVKLMYQRIPLKQRQSIPIKKIQKRVLERMVTTELQLQIARRSGYTVPSSEIDASIGRLAKANKVSPKAFMKLLKKDNVNLDLFKKTIREQLLIQHVQAGYVHHSVKVSEQEVNNFLKILEQSQDNPSSEYHLGHILISVPEGATPSEINNAQLKAQEIVEKLNNGAKFSTLSITLSDANNALEGGDLGWQKLAQMSPILSPYIRKMHKGDVSQPIQSPSGFHIVKLYDSRGPKKLMSTKTHVRHILIKINALITDQVARDRLLNLRSRIKNGENFEALARAHSEDRGSAIKGGSLGWVQPGALVPAFETAMNDLAINEIGIPVQSQFGWHLIQVLGREDQDNTQLIREAQARRQIQQRKSKQAINTWLTKLRDEAYIEYRIEF
ncbi:MAG: peptidylprolyl isomerase [Cycloclasticus sp. symbiont of Poecilosclerida sp. M]|nr:MAG: peptidylprolyl isomerase [Cycloclasticus sp. symbiont of Poecilosclerida sp. M]